MIVSDFACQTQSSSCSIPLPPLYTQSGPQLTLAENNSAEISATQWDNISYPLRLSGIGQYIMDRFTFMGNYVDNSGFFRADNVTANFPGGSKYTLSVGMVSGH